MEKTILGIDIGGTKMEAALFQDKLELTKLRTPTMRDSGYEVVMKRLHDLIQDTLSLGKMELSHIAGIGLGLPGTLDPRTGKMINGNSEIFIGQDIKNDLLHLLGLEIPIRMANDANLFALAETYHGAGAEFEKRTGIVSQEQIAIGIILGTGNGGGIIIKGSPFEGRHGGGAEVGHHVLHSGGRPCYCGRRGCAEQYLCGPSVEQAYESETGEKLRASEIFQQTTAAANKIKEQYKSDLLEFLTNLSTLFDPDYFVLGGGMSTIDSIYEGLEEKLWKQVYVKDSNPLIYKHRVGDSAGVLGAAMLFKDA